MGEQTQVSRQTLEATYGRAVQFLRGVGTSPVIRGQVEAYGYTDEAHDEGWRFVLAAGGYQPAAPAPLTVAASEARDAMTQVDVSDEPLHGIIRLTLGRRFPEQAAFLLEGLAPATGMASVAGVATLLDRIDSLESGEGRQGSRKQDKAALDLLAQRTITPARRKELRGLIARARKGDEAAPAVDPKRVEAEAARDKAHEEALVALRHWYEEWSGIARIALTRRDHLIAVGLAKRKTRAAKGDSNE